MSTRKIALVSGGLVLALVLAGCAGATTMGDHSATTTPAPDSTYADASHNEADVAFAMDMIVHHEQAIDMAAVLLEKDGVDERVVELARAIQEAQEPEITTMTAWLDAWGEPAGSDEMDGMEGMDHGSTMSDDDMDALASASGAEASRLFLKQMTVHHEGAIEMAQEELDAGENVDAVTLAQKIIDDQTAEITVMSDLLGEL